LYWYFFHQHRQVFENHPRLPWVYRQWDRMSNNARHDIIASAEHFLATMNNPPAHAIE
jgi:deoxyribodipyrimidine photolyase-related protein